MKTVKLYIIVLIFGLMAFTACNEFLDVKPTNSLTSSESIKTYEDAQIALNGLVEDLLSSSFYGRNVLLYADAKGGDLHVPSNGNGYDDLFHFDHSAVSSSYSGFWSKGYECIADINFILESVLAIEDNSTEDFSDVKGQLYTYRGMIYFDLCRIYGRDYAYDKTALAVPIILEVDASARPARSTVEEVYAQALDDLEMGARYIGKERNNGFINYYGNLAIRARMAMHMQNYTEALSLCKEIMESGLYTLYTNDEWAASWASKWQSESIIEFGVFDNETDLGNSSLGTIFKRKLDGGSRVYGNFVCGDQFLARMNEDKDDEQGKLRGKGADIRWAVMDYDSIDDSRYGCVLKYVGGAAKNGDGESSETAVNIKLCRLSEIYLIAAEAAYKLGDLSSAATYLQAIRQRNPALDEATSANITLDMIMDEKSREFLQEGIRYWDRIRNDDTITFDDEVVGNEEVPHPSRESTIDLKTFYKVILPISEYEMTHNENLIQNPGY